MKRGTSLLLVVTLMASVLAGALSVSSVRADNSTTVYHFMDFLFDCSSDFYSYSGGVYEYNDVANFFNYCNDYMQHEGYFVVLIHDLNTSWWNIVLYENTHYSDYPSLNYWNFNNRYGFSYRNRYQTSFFPSFTAKAWLYLYDDGTYTGQYICTGVNVSINTYKTGTGHGYNSWNSSNITDSNYDQAIISRAAIMSYGNLDAEGRLCLCSQSVNAGSYDSTNMYLSSIANLLPGTSIYEPFDFHWFKFNLGDRWYITTYDQSIVLNMQQGDDTFWMWAFSLYSYESEDSESLSLWYRDMQFVPYAENFITQQVTNVSSSGIYCYDITELINNGSYIQLALSEFYQVLDTPSGYVLGNVMAESEDIVSLVLNPSEENESQNEAWNQINEYFQNYPSVTIVPEQLASHLSGGHALTSGTGFLQLPNELYKYTGIDPEVPNYFIYDLSQTVFDPAYNSMINFDLLNVAVLPTRFNDQIELLYWDSYEQLNSGILDLGSVGDFAYTNDLYEIYDLILFTDGSKAWFQDPRSTYVQSGYHVSTIGYVGEISMNDLNSGYPIYWILTDKAITKSQLFVFCDSQRKLYNLLSDYIEKRDLWDSSFFQWSMSVFWELESLNGHLNSIDSLLSNLHLEQKLNDIIDGLNRIGDNTDETKDPVWYVSLWNWVRDFTPSDDAFITGLNALDDGLNNIPALPAPTGSPGYPLLPTFTPTPSTDPGGV